MKLRPFSGRSTILLESMTVPTAAFSVSSSAPVVEIDALGLQHLECDALDFGLPRKPPGVRLRRRAGCIRNGTHQGGARLLAARGAGEYSEQQP
jgi:hypothetical protein